MSPARSRIFGCWLLVFAPLLAASAAHAQDGKSTTPPAAIADDAVEAYMDRLGLTRLMAEQLAQRLNAAEKDARRPIAERLGKMYVQLLSAAETPEQREYWEQRGRALLKDVPEADTGELRLNLGKTLYIRVEEVVERGRLRLADATELKDAEARLRSLEPEFTEIARRAHSRVDERERAETSGNNSEELANELSDARRLRSLAFYYAGWCHYYLGLLTHSEPEAVEAMKCFGWLLNSSGGRIASVDRLPTDLLRYEHIARAAIGCALAASLRGNDVEAVRWLDAIADAEEVAPAVRDQLLVRRIIVLGQAKRWADMEQLIRRARRGEKLHGYGGGANVHEPEPLPVGPARLLAVLTLEADSRVAGPQVESLARTALGDLVARQEIAQVLDLVRRYGTAPIGDTGFIVHYVRGLLQYDQARAAHKAGGDSGDDPSAAPEVVNLYRAAATMLEVAMKQPDAETYKADRAKAGVMLARCFYYAGDLRQAGEKFAAAWEVGGKAAGGDAMQESLWLAVLAFDKAAKAGGAGAAEAERRRAEVGALYLATYPDSPRAARIVLMQTAAGADVGDNEALRVLSEVPKDSPVYETARRQVARLLYAKFRSAKGADRDLAAMRFISVAEELLAIDRKTAMEGARSDAAPACERLVTRVRQMLDALLGTSSPDAVRANAVLGVLEGVAKYNNLDLSTHESELTYRRLQIALATNKEAEAISLADRLSMGDASAVQFATAADRLLYKRIAARWKQAASATSASAPTREDTTALVRFGKRVIDRIGGDAVTLHDASVLTLYSTVAAAATILGDNGDAASRELAMALDQSVLKASPRSEESLRRLAHNAEVSAKPDLAIDCWRTLFTSAEQGSPEWFEARYQSLRLLKSSSPDKARELLTQLKALYPDLGPSPWGDKLRELDQELGGGATTTPPPGGAQ